MSSREMILEKLHKAVLPGHSNQRIMPLVEARTGDLDVFVAKATAAAALVTRTTGQDAPAAVKAILEEIACKSIILSDEEIVKELDIQTIAGNLRIDCQYTSEIPEDEYRSRMFQAEAGLSGCDYALADSGSLVMQHDGENQRLISLAPNYFIGIVKASQMLKDRFDLAALLEKGEKTAAVSLVTGVSRTADVALQVVLGMHGPRKVYIVLIED
jgi:L-lactate dehydrogenase complex protein LldG